jgi:hypothetical protein
VAAPLFAVAVLALVFAWGHSFAPTTHATGTITGGLTITSSFGTCSDAKCSAPTGGTFNVQVNITALPAGGINGFQSEIDYAALVANGGSYKATADAADEIVWASSTLPLRSPAAPTGVEGLVNHASSTALPALPKSNVTGLFLTISMNCSDVDSAGNDIILVPLGAGNTNGAGVGEFGTGKQVPLSDAIEVNCTPPPTNTPPPPTNTPPDFPQMQKCLPGTGGGDTSDPADACSSLRNLFLTRQGTKVPPLTCAGGNNSAIFEESLSIPIPDIQDPKEAPGVFSELGAFEFEIHFDDTKVCVNIVAADAADDMLCVVEDKDSSQLEGVARIGCVTLGKDNFPDTTTPEGRHLADVVVRPQPDVYSQAKPNQDNGVVIQLNNVLCELADLQGHPLPVFSCEDADLTIRYLEGDVNPDCAINSLDTQAIAFRWGVEKGSLIYTEFMNLEPSGAQADNDIDIKDLQFVFGRFGSTCAAPHPPQNPVNPKA